MTVTDLSQSSWWVRSRFGMDARGEHFKRLPHARTGMKRKVLRVAIDAMILHRRNAWIFAPESLWRSGIVTHLTIKYDLRFHRDNIFDAQVRPAIARTVSNVDSARDMQQFVEIGSAPYRDERLMPNDHEHRPQLDAFETPAHIVEVLVDARKQITRLLGTADPITDRSDALLDLLERVVFHDQRRVTHAVERLKCRQIG